MEGQAVMLAPFEASRLKLARARRHVEELDTEINKFFARKPCVVRVETFFDNAIPGTCSFVSRVKEGAPTHLAPIIGDIVHNLRTSLDLIACDLVRLSGRSTSSVYFPFCESQSDLKDTIKRRKVHHAGADVVEVIESLKPFKGGNYALRALHDLDVDDKHKALLLTIAAASLPLAEILNAPAEWVPEARTWNTIISDGHMIVGLPQYLSPPLGTELPSRFFLCFMDGDAFVKGKPVLEFLHFATNMVDGIVNALASLRPSASFPAPAT